MTAVETIYEVFSNDAFLGRDLNLTPNTHRADTLHVMLQSWVLFGVMGIIGNINSEI